MGIASKDQIQRAKKIFFYRICGTGMGAAAILLKERGAEVFGADSSYYPPMSDYLKKNNIPLFDLADMTKSRLEEYDLIIVGNSVPRGSPGAALIEGASTPYCSFPTALGELVLKDRHVIGVSGTHGKTTTTYFIKQLLVALGEQAGHLIGGVMEELPAAELGSSQYFVIESDEYDSAYFLKEAKFLSYEIDSLIISSLEFDHADIYDSIEDIKDEFRNLIPKLSTPIVAHSGYPAIKELASEFSNQTFHYFDQGEVKTLAHNRSSFEVLGHEFETNLVGEHNILNIKSALCVLSDLGFDLESLRDPLLQMKMVKRRQEIRGLYQGAVVIDDFAHHPKACQLTIDGVKKMFPEKKLLAVFEPVSATARSSIFQKEFSESFDQADSIIIAKSSLKTTVSKGDLDAHKLCAEIEGRGKEALVCETLESLRSLLDQKLNEKTVALIMSNRTCLGLWESDFVKALR